MFRPHSLPLLLLLLAVLLLLRPVVGQASSSGAFIPTVPATATLPTATAGSTSDDLSNTTANIVCPARYHDCAVIGRPEACCALDQVCGFDDSGTIGCCPFRTVCVGKLDVSGVKRNTLMSPSLAAGAVALAAGYWVRGNFAIA